MHSPPTSGVESFRGKSEPGRNLNSNFEQPCYRLLPKSFWWRTIFYNRSVFCYRSLSLHLFLSPSISLGFCFFSVFFGSFLLFGLLGKLFGLANYWAFFIVGFWVQICKKEHQQYVIRSNNSNFRKILVDEIFFNIIIITWNFWGLI